MKILFTKRAETSLQKLPTKIQEKAQKQFSLLLANYRHPSLRTKKMGGSDRFEARIDIHYRFTFLIEGNEIVVLSTGLHDVGLGKK